MANEYLQRTPTSTGNRKVWTWSAWIKRSNFTSQATTLFSAATSGNDQVRIAIRSAADGAGLFFQDYTSGASQLEIDTSSGMKLRDFSSWMNLIVAIDTTKNTEGDRVKLYVNGVLYAGPLASIYIGGINYNTRINQTILHTIGWLTAGGSQYAFLGELADVFLIDGQALTPDVFGFNKPGKGYISAGSTQATDFRNGQWVPRKPGSIIQEINDGGGFGVNGFYLPMNDSNNFGADFHCDPNSIITLNEKLPQPRVGVATTATAGIGFTDALRADPYAANLVLAIPGVIGGQGSGYGDYSANIKGSGSNKTVTAFGNAGVAVTASYYGSALTFDGSGDYFTVPTNSDFAFGTGDFTLECWFIPNGTPSDSPIFESRDGSVGATNGFTLTAFSSSVIRIFSGSVLISSSATYTNQWNHIAVTRFSGTLNLFINGVNVGISTASLNMTNGDCIIGGGRYGGTSTINASLNGYLQDLRVYKGVAKYTGGFDVSRPYTPVGIATFRAVPDTCLNNFATLNPLVPSVFSSGDRSIVNGNLTVTTITTGNATNARSTIGVSTGKWYAETYISGDTLGGGGFLAVRGIGRTDSQLLGSGGDAIHYYGGNGQRYDYTNGSLTISSYGSSYTIGDVVGIGINANNGEVTFYKNGVSQGVAKTFPTSQYPLFIQMEDGASAHTVTYNMNFGQNPTFSGNTGVNTTAGTFTDSNGKGLFKYEPPSGFLALCEDNLPKPTIEDPGKYFKTVLWTGDGNSGRSIVGVGFTPDLVWIKNRSNAASHIINDSVRGAGINLFSNGTSAENASGGVGGDLFQSFNFDGFSINPNYAGSSNNGTNSSGQTYTAWCWRAGGGSTQTNTNGSIISVVSVNQDAGFSIVSYTGNNTAGATVGHGLGKTPSMIILKSRSLGTDWIVQHKSAGTAPSKLILNSTGAVTNSAPEWNNTLPNSSTFTIGPTGYSVNNPGATYIAYCWAEIEGFSKFGSYVGNGSADGPFVYCGFKPAFVICKVASGGAGDWEIHDSSRASTNPSDKRLYANLTIIEGSGDAQMDFLSNGFKIRTTYNNVNASGATIIFAAFAESPFQTANAK